LRLEIAGLDLLIDVRVIEEGNIEMALVHQDFHVRGKNPPHPGSRHSSLRGKAPLLRFNGPHRHIEILLPGLGLFHGPEDVNRGVNVPALAEELPSLKLTLDILQNLAFFDAIVCAAQGLLTELPQGAAFITSRLQNHHQTLAGLPGNDFQDQGQGFLYFFRFLFRFYLDIRHASSPFCGFPIN